MSPLSPTSSGSGSSSGGGGGGGGALTQIANSLLAAPAASIDFPGIAGLFNHLLIVGYLRGDTAAVSTGCVARLNNDNAANYDEERVQASAAVPTSAEALGGTSMTVAVIPAATATAAYFGAILALIPSYLNATGDKPLLSPFWFATSNISGAQQVGIGGGKWRTAGTPVSRVTLLPGAGNFVAGSHATLYGLT